MSVSTIPIPDPVAKLSDPTDSGPFGATSPAACTRCAELEAELEADRATLDDTRAELAAARAIPAHAQELADNVRQALGRPSCDHSADVAAALAQFDLRLRGAR